MTPRRRARRMPLDADGLLSELHDLAADHFGRPAHMLSTDRRGRFEGGWIRPAPGAPYLPLTPRKGMPMSLRQKHIQTMAAHVRAYAAHHRADPGRVTRAEGWPECIELVLP